MGKVEVLVLLKAPDDRLLAGRRCLHIPVLGWGCGHVTTNAGLTYRCSPPSLGRY